MVAWGKPFAGGIRVTVQITPNVKKSEIIGVLGNALVSYLPDVFGI